MWKVKLCRALKGSRSHKEANPIKNSMIKEKFKKWFDVKMQIYG
jgi:hypothetical protein